MGSLCLSPGDNVTDNPPKKEQKKKAEEKKESRVYERDLAICDLKKRRRDGEAYIKKMEVKINESKETARKFAKSKEKSKALFAMKLKKMYEATKDKVCGMVHMLETTIISLEQAQMDVDVYQALKQGDEVLKQVTSKVNVEAFQEIYENQQEYNKVAEYMKEEVIGDEEEYSQELANLEEQLQGMGEENAAEMQVKLDSEALKAPTVEAKVEVEVSVQAEEEKKELVLA